MNDVSQSSFQHIDKAARRSSKFYERKNLPKQMVKLIRTFTCLSACSVIRKLREMCKIKKRVYNFRNNVRIVIEHSLLLFSDLQIH